MSRSDTGKWRGTTLSWLNTRKSHSHQLTRQRIRTTSTRLTVLQ